MYIYIYAHTQAYTHIHAYTRTYILAAFRTPLEDSFESGLSTGRKWSRPLATS